MHKDGRGPVAQLVEPPAHNRIVVGSKPAGSTMYFNGLAIAAHLHDFAAYRTNAKSTLGKLSTACFFVL